jgi:addiction module RelB/DinJ family antitoxin
MTETVNVTIRLDRKLKSNAESMLKDMGMSLSTAVNIFLKQTVRQREIPFRIDLDSSPGERPRTTTETEQLTDIFARLGPWEDSRDAETIIEDIRSSRVSKQDIVL